MKTTKKAQRLLAEMAAIHARFEVFRQVSHGELAFLQLQCALELVGEVFQPFFQCQPFRSAGLAS